MWTVSFLPELFPALLALTLLMLVVAAPFVRRHRSVSASGQPTEAGAANRL